MSGLRLLIVFALVSGAGGTSHAASCPVTPPSGIDCVESLATKDVTAFSVCKRITNSHASLKPLMVPVKTNSEWSGFYTNASGGITIGACTACNGVSVGGGCWYLGAGGESCNTVCASHGGCMAATESYAGFSGSQSNCGSVLTALGVSAGVFNPGAGVPGCATNSTLSLRYYNDTSAQSCSSSDFSLRRACACAN